MKANLAKRLQKLEQDAQAHQARFRPKLNAVETVRGWLRDRGIEQQAEESLAETFARAVGMSSAQLREWLRIRACA